MTHLSVTCSGKLLRSAAPFLAVFLLVGCQLPQDLSASGYARIGSLDHSARSRERIAEQYPTANSRRDVLPARSPHDERNSPAPDSSDRPFRTDVQPVGHWTPHPPHEAYHVSVPQPHAPDPDPEPGNLFDASNSRRPDFLPNPVSGLGVEPRGRNAEPVPPTCRVEREILPCPLRRVSYESERPGSCGQTPASGCGPLSECCSERFTFRSDLKGFGRTLRDDARDIVNWNNALILTAATGAAIAIRQDIDREVRQKTARHPNRWGSASETLGKFGDVPIQIPSMLALYSYSLWTQDAELHDFSGTLISAYTITGVSTVLLKAAVNTDRPSDEWNGGQYGFPSYHTASSFTIAAVVDEYYGPRAGIPAYLMAGLIGWSRIDERDHDVSDVMFGAALGYVIGKSVAGRHLYGDSRVRLLPYVHPLDGSAGMMLETRY